MHMVINLLIGVLAPETKFNEERENEPDTGKPEEMQARRFAVPTE